MSTRRDRGTLERLFSRDDDEVLDRLVQDARSEWVPPSSHRQTEAEGIDEAEQKLLARVEAYEAGASRERNRLALRGDLWRPLALVTAAAAAVVFFARPNNERTLSEAERAPQAPSTTALAPVTPPPVEAPRPKEPAALAGVTGGGELLVNGVRVSERHASLHDGETATARGGDAVFAAPGRVDWSLERGTEVTVVRAGTNGGAIVLGLRVGAVEAQVTPVAAGEAFAVDIEGVRVAVHGTHLRVARTDRDTTKVVVDLSEGVISVGTPPKAGSTVGQLVMAPAHVEFSVADVSGSLRVEHDPSRVRAPVDQAMLGRSTESSTPTSVLPVVIEASGNTPPASVTSRASSSSAPRAPGPTETIDAAVRTCADQVLPAGTGAVTISSMLTVNVSSGGQASFASFDPPLVPEFQACVGRTVYAIRWGEPGPHHIPIEVHR
jgi:hypothetical protein